MLDCSFALAHIKLVSLLTVTSKNKARLPLLVSHEMKNISSDTTVLKLSVCVYVYVRACVLFMYTFICV